MIIEALRALHAETLLAAGYAGFLVFAAAGIELFAWLTHHGMRRAKTVGVRYLPHASAWECSEGTLLPLQEIDHDNRIARYRARASTCNRCARKADCTDSDEGRELVHSLEDWERTQIGRFHRVLALTLIVLAGLVLAVAAVRHYHSSGELVLLALTSAGTLWAGRRILADLSAHWRVPAIPGPRRAARFFGISHEGIQKWR